MQPTGTYFISKEEKEKFLKARLEEDAKLQRQFNERANDFKTRIEKLRDLADKLSQHAQTEEQRKLANNRNIQFNDQVIAVNKQIQKLKAQTELKQKQALEDRLKKQIEEKKKKQLQETKIAWEENFKYGDQNEDLPDESKNGENKSSESNLGENDKEG